MIRFKNFMLTFLILITLRTNTAFSQLQSGSMAEGIAIAVVGGVVGVSALVTYAIYANEIEAGPVLSFYRSGEYQKFVNNEYYYSNRSSVIYPGIGMHLMDRINFKHSDMEIGLKSITYRVKIERFDTEKSNGQTSITHSEHHPKIWGAHINYLQHLFYNKLPERMCIFLGPSINLFFNEVNYYTFNLNYNETELGFGGITGISYKLIDRVRLNLRYELTTRSNQVQFGISYLYHKKHSRKG